MSRPAPAWGIPLPTRVPRGVRGPDHGHRGLLLVGHGSRCAISEAEMRALGDLVAAALPDVVVGVGFLEMTDPPAGVVLDQLVARGVQELVVLPLVLLGAGHAKSDVPAVVVEGRQRHPGVDIAFGAPLGVAKPALALLGDAVVDAGGRGLPLLVVARGTSDPDANGDAAKATRLIGEWTGAPFSYTGFSGVTAPSVIQAVEVVSRLGYSRIAIAWWYLCYGKLIERGRQELTEWSSQTGTEIIDAGHLGPAPELVPVIAERYRQARGGTISVNCDACAYRAAWPGLEARVGQAIGIGHSHLAEEHRHHHH